MANGSARERRGGDVLCLFQQVSQTAAAAAAGVGRWDQRSSSFLSSSLHFNGSNATNLKKKRKRKNSKASFWKDNNENIWRGEQVRVRHNHDYLDVSWFHVGLHTGFLNIINSYLNQSQYLLYYVIIFFICIYRYISYIMNIFFFLHHSHFIKYFCTILSSYM